MMKKAGFPGLFYCLYGASFFSDFPKMPLPQASPLLDFLADQCLLNRV
jgi:hypothetical protein